MLILAPGLARAQEVTKGWHTYATTGGQPLPTERDAQRVIEASFEMYQQFGAFSWEVRDQTILDEKNNLRLSGEAAGHEPVALEVHVGIAEF